MLLFLIPNFLDVKQIKIIPVIYRKPIEVQLKTLPPSHSSRAKERNEKQNESLQKSDASHFLKKEIKAISLGRGLFLPPPLLQLPPSEVVDTKNQIEELYTYNVPNKNRIGTYPIPMGTPKILPDTSYLASNLASPKGREDFTEGIIRELMKEIQSASKKSEKARSEGKSKKKSSSNIKLGVEGPISERRVLYRPPLPTVVSERSVQIKLKFWVSPNGVVDQIIPLERGGTHLETVAIQFLKRWKFEPLPSGMRQERQWGILTVKFIVK